MNKQMVSGCFHQGFRFGCIAGAILALICDIQYAGEMKEMLFGDVMLWKIIRDTWFSAGLIGVIFGAAAILVGMANPQPVRKC